MDTSWHHHSEAVMTLEQLTELYATVLRTLLPSGAYDTSPHTAVLSKDIYAHAKLFAGADLNAKRILNVLEGIPVELLTEYEAEYGLPLKCMLNASLTIQERLEILEWVRKTQNVLNLSYLKQVLAIFGIVLLDIIKYRPLQCIGTCTSAVNTEQLRYKVTLVVPDPLAADIECIIENYLPAYLRVDVVLAKAVYKTSKPYPVEHVDGYESSFDIAKVVQESIYNAQDHAEHLINLMQVKSMRLYKALVDPININSENLASSLLISEATLRSVLSKISLETESLTTSFAISSASLKSILLSNSMKSESLTCSFAINNSASLKSLLVQTKIELEAFISCFSVSSASLQTVLKSASIDKEALTSSFSIQSIILG